MLEVVSSLLYGELDGPSLQSILVKDSNGGIRIDGFSWCPTQTETNTCGIDC